MSFSSSHEQAGGSWDRGRERGRGRGHGRNKQSAALRGSRQDWRSSASKILRSLSPPKDSVLTCIHYHDLEIIQGSSNDASIINVEDVASYNWINASEPTIMTPGMPPRWTPVANLPKLAEDDPNGTYYRDPNAAYFPTYPMEPVIRSIFESRPDFNTQDVDVFGCGSTLGNLLRFASNIETEKPFRFLVDVVGETVFFIRRETSPKETIQGIRGFGHSFPDANTTWDAEARNSLTHQRIICYQLGGLDTIIRFEADSYLAEKVSAARNKKKNAISAVENVDEDDISSALAQGTINVRNPGESDLLQISRGQDSVPQAAIFDLKTRSIKRKYIDTTSSEQLPRLWLRPISFFILAYHENGLFRTEDIAVNDVQPEIAKWESDHRGDVRKFVCLIKKIASVVKSASARTLEIRYREESGLELCEQVDGLTSVLPAHLATQWEAQGHRTESTGDESLSRDVE